MNDVVIDHGASGNVIALEHVNVAVADQRMAMHFYVDGLGFVRDKEYETGLSNLWVNLGPTQFHLPTGTSQVLRGHVGVVMPDRDALLDRLVAIADDLSSTAFGFVDRDQFVEITSPWGNQLRVFEPDATELGLGAGIDYVEFEVPVGVASGIAAFYSEMLGAPAEIDDDGTGVLARCSLGAYQSLLFREIENEIAPYDGHHIQIYVADITTPREKLRERGLVYGDQNPNQFRFSDNVDLASGERLYEVEHEVRATSHPMFGRL